MKITLGSFKKLIKEAVVSAELLGALSAWAGQDPTQSLRMEAPYEDPDTGDVFDAAVVDGYHMVAAYVDHDGKLMVNTPDGFEEMTIDQMYQTEPLA